MSRQTVSLSGLILRPLVIVVALLGLPRAAARETQRLDAGWTFAAGDAPAALQPVTLPHDWSIARPVDHAAPAAGHGGFFPTGTGEYRRIIAAPAEWSGRRVVLELEGVAGLAEVLLNGVPLGRHVYAFTPFHVDLTPQLKAGADNVLVVRVDHSAQPAARWYVGSGLYRPVWLRVTDPVHVPAGGVFITTEELTPDQARLRVHTEVGNTADAAADVTVETELLDPDGRPLATVRMAGRVPAAGEWKGSIDVVVPRPQAWSPESPRLHRAITRILADGRARDAVSTTFGIRTVRVSAERGFELNGRPVKLLGGNVHADTGPLGAAAFDRAEERKVELLKAAGFNAVRTAHHPPSTAFLAACDRLGLLVMDEIFDGWEKSKNPSDYGMHFKEWWQRDVDAWVRRDRHHASVVLWSAGNEMFERGNAGGQRIARELAARIRASDPSRPVSAGVNGLGKSGEWSQLDPLFAAFDIAGYNYELTRHADDHARLPARIIVAAESYQSEAFANWAAMQDNAYIIGDFVWSALDYLGESGIGRVFPPGEEAKKHWEADMWPWHGAYCGDLDLTGWRKPVSHYRNIIWDRGEKLYAAVLVPPPGGEKWNVTPWSVPPALPAWTWPGQEGQPLAVEVYSRHEA
ncbi:MAG: glycoside hydrolase family 2 TIM barrel-domain containing protein, partial [Lacunisphaera sp.]|nr:glycoside hydrolase family 2 TIM barrel-domain containing protein [Lacunisphaera sp.]